MEGPASIEVESGVHAGGVDAIELCEVLCCLQGCGVVEVAKEGGWEFEIWVVGEDRCGVDAVVVGVFCEGVVSPMGTSEGVGVVIASAPFLEAVEGEWVSDAFVVCVNVRFGDLAGGDPQGCGWVFSPLAYRA